MESLRIRSAAEQVADYLREGIERGRWRGLIPGSGVLAAELGVNHKTVEAALGQLERSGVIEGRGARRRRMVVEGDAPARAMRVAILSSEAADRKLDYMADLRHGLMAAGHSVVAPPETMGGLGMDVGRVARVARRMEADAWVVVAGSREVLGWFATCGVPTIALFGRRQGLGVAGVGPDKRAGYAAATRRLVGLGHRRIVLLARRRRRLPEPGAAERAFLGELGESGLRPGDYHLPDWEEGREGLQGLLGSLFKVTPPTALIVDEAPIFSAVGQFCARHGLRVPEDVSLVCTDPDPTFSWCEPTVAHIGWEAEPVVRRIVRWANRVGRGIRDERQTLTAAAYIDGGTVGAVAGA